MNKAKNRGFSLVELLIAIAILSIIMVMISGFVSSTLISQRKTKKNMQMQAEAQRIYYQLSEIIMQATYIRVQAEDGSVYVPDNYANYQLGGNTDSQKVIVDFATGELYNEKGKKYPTAGSQIDNDTGTILSYRALISSTSTDEMKEYNAISPKYLYIEYSSAKEKKAYVIFRYDSSDDKLYMYRSAEMDENQVPGTAANFAVAKNAVDTQISTNTADENGLVSRYLKSFGLTVNPDTNAVTFNMELEDPKFKGYNYKLNETVNIRNSNVLTVKPQLLNRWTGSTP